MRGGHRGAKTNAFESFSARMGFEKPQCKMPAGVESPLVSETFMTDRDRNRHDQFTRQAPTILQPMRRRSKR